MSRKPAAKSVAMLVRQGYEQLRDGAVAEALDTFSAALAIEPDTADALRGRGLAYAEQKQWRQAAEQFRQARDLSPEQPDNWVDLGISLAMDNQIYRAMEVFETLLAKQPTCVRGYLELGLLYVRLGAIPKGRQQLEKALTCRPTPEQRQFIQAALREQAKLDRKRWYRPDFEALRRPKKAS